MKNTTVGEMIELLKEMDQDAVMCITTLSNDGLYYLRVEIIRQKNNVSYIGHDGGNHIGNVVWIG